MFILLTVISITQISDPDIWFHLSIGREVFNSLAIPANEFLVYPNAGSPGVFHEWGFGLLHYLTHEIGGYWGMSVLNAVMTSMTLYLLYRAAGPQKGDEPLYFIVALAALVWMEARLVYRPEMVLYLVLAAEILLLERFLAARNWRWLLPLPLLGFLLSQAHPSIIFMIAILGGYALQVVWECRSDLPSARKPLIWLIITGVATLVLAAINPYGIQQIVLPFDFLAAGRVTGMVEEFQNVLQANHHWSYFTLFSLSFLALLLTRKRRLVDWLFFIVFATLAFRYVRNIALFALVMYVPLARGFSDALSRFSTWLKHSVPRFQSWWVTAVSWGAAFLMLSALLFTPIVIRPWGAGPVQGMFPETAAAVIREIKPPGRIFNFYDIGGYLGWVLDGEYQVSIDGRHYSANRALSLHHAVTTGRPGWQRPLEQYEVNTIVIQGTYNKSGALVPLVQILAADPEWSLVARGDRALLFMRKHIASGLPPQFNLDKSEVWHQVIMEADYVLEQIPFSPKAHLARAEALLALGHVALARREFETYLDMVPADPDIEMRLRSLEKS